MSLFTKLPSAEERKKREVRLKRCVEDLQVIAYDEVDDEDDAALSYAMDVEAGIGGPPVEAKFSGKIKIAGGLKGVEQVEKPSVSLRSFFPQTWLFTLEVLDDALSLER